MTLAVAVLAFWGCGSSVPDPQAPSDLARFDLRATDVASVAVHRGGDSAGEPTLYVTLTPDASRRLEAFTAGHVGERVAIFVDGEKVLEPELRDPIANGHLEITGPSEDELREMEENLSN